MTLPVTVEPFPERSPHARRLPLALKLALAFVALVAITLFANGAINFWLAFNEAKTSAFRVQQEQAQAAAEKIALSMADIERQIGWTTRSEWARIPPEQQRYDFIRLLRQSPAITEIRYIDRDGREQLKLSRLDPDSLASAEDFSHDPRFSQAIASKVWYGPVYFRRGSEPYFTVSVSHSGGKPGVTSVEVNLKLISDVINAIHVGDKGYAYIVNAQGKLVAHPDMSLVLRDTDLSKLPQVAGAIAGGAQAPLNTTQTAQSVDGEEVLTAHAAIPRLGWLVFVQLPLNEALAPVYAALRQTAALLGLGVLLATLMGAFVARRIVAPITRLQQGAERLGAGDLSQRISIRTGDEIETLADRFNGMAGRLQESYSTLEAKVEARTRDLAEALRFQTATSQVLNVISQSPDSLQPALDIIVKTSRELCETENSTIWMLADGKYHLTAVDGFEPSESHFEYLRNHPIDPVERGSSTGRAIREKQTVHIPDITQDPDYGIGAMGVGPPRALLSVPLLRNGEAVAAISMARPDGRPFTPQQIELVETFADQAVIAIQNAQLFNETQEALERQTATSEILRAISQSPTDVRPVFQTIVATAARLLRCDLAFVLLTDGESLWAEAIATPKGPQPNLIGRKSPVDPTVNFPSRAIRAKAMLHIPDWSKIELPAHERLIKETYGVLSTLYLPLIRDDVCIGLLTLASGRVNSLSAPEIILAESFRDQAMIAIQNVRLFDEVQARTRDLQESLEQQTATADVLKVISRSAFDLKAVLDTLASSASRLCGDARSAIYLLRDGLLHLETGYNISPEWIAHRQSHPLAPSRETPSGRAALTGHTDHVPDLREDPDFARPELQQLGDYRATLNVPLIREGATIGVLSLARPHPGAFMPRQIELAQSFADQAVIAIENVRLFNETQEALERQITTAEILRAIAGSPSDAQPVFESIVVSAVKRLRCDLSFVFLADDATYRPVAAAGPAGLLSDLGPGQVPIDWDANFPSRALLSKETYYLPDWSLVELPPHERVIHELLGLSSCIYMPLIRDGKARGLLALGRNRASSFSASDIAQAEAFRDQAIIALENARLFNETKEALERQTATAEILRVIASSPTDVQPVFEAIAASANRLLGGLSTAVWRFHEDHGYLAAFTPTNPEADAALQALSPLPNADFAVFGELSEGKITQLSDTEEGPPRIRDLARLRGYRAMLFVPLMAAGASIGFVSVTRREVGAFDPDDVKMLQTFADQAVIAIENVRLFDEVQAKTRDLATSLERQTATSEILRVISQSPNDTTPVFEAIALAAIKLLRSDLAGVCIVTGAWMFPRAVATPRGLVRDMGRDHNIDDPDASFPARALAAKKTLYLPDWSQIELPESEKRVQAASGMQSCIYVPMMRGGEGVGMLIFGSKRPNAFDPAMIAQAESFTDQALIAIENVRLFTETKEALEQQTATAEVLNVISRSPDDLKPVLEAIAQIAGRVCRANDAHIYMLDGDSYMLTASTSPPDDPWLHYVRAVAITRDMPGSATARAARDLRTVHVPDTSADLEHDQGVFKNQTPRSVVSVPLVRDGIAVGVITLNRKTVDPFAPRLIELLTTFADQAVIAVANTQLFNEVQAKTRDLEESLAQQTATADVLKVISRSVFELDTVLQTLIDTAVRLGRGSRGTIFIRKGDELVASAFHRGVEPELRAWLEATRFPLDADSNMAMAAREKRVVQYADMSVRQDAITTEALKRATFGAALWVPLMRDQDVIGVFGVNRKEKIAFTEREVELVQTFADQAVIAIENSRLFDEVQAKTRDLTASLHQQTATADVLKVISRSAFDLQPVLDTLTYTARDLCEADYGLIWMMHDGKMHLDAHCGLSPDNVALLLNHPIVPDANSTRPASVAAATGQTVHTEHFRMDPSFKTMEPGADAMRVTGLAVPLKRADRIEGVITVGRFGQRRFTDNQVNLVQTFADQALIAIENVRLFEAEQTRTRELAASLENLRATQDRLIQSEKLASLGQLTAGIAHEIKNPLNFVNNFSSLSGELIEELNELLAPLPFDGKIREEVEELTGMLKGNLEKVVQHGKRADSIVKNMLLHSREGSGEARAVDVNALVEESLNLAYHGARAEKPGFNITLARDLDPTMGQAELYPQEITRVLLNLISNGFYAAIKRKQQGAETGFEPTLKVATKNLGAQIEILVRDNGTGIPPEVKEKIFNPFFTTKPAGEGTGLGLSMSHDIIVKQHQGTISVTTEPGQFTEFTLVLPRNPGAKAAPGEVK